MHISIDTDEPLSDLDKSVLALLAGGATAPAPAAKAATASTPTKAAAPSPAKEEVKQSEPEKDSDGDTPEVTMKTAVDLATSMVADGKAADVKAALASAGVKRVSELEGDAIAEFVNTLR